MYCCIYIYIYICIKDSGEFESREGGIYFDVKGWEVKAGSPSLAQVSQCGLNRLPAYIVRVIN